VLVLGGVGFAASPAWGDRDRDFNVTAKVTDINKDDNGRDGPSPGDRLSFNTDLFRGNRVGSGDGVCVITDDPAPANDFISKCRVTFRLPDGTLLMEGKVTGSDFGNGEFTIPVVDGTGSFHDAAGEAHFAQVDDSYNSGYGSGYSYGYDSRSGYHPYADTAYSAQSADSDPAKAKDKDGDDWRKKKDEGDNHKDGDKPGDKRKDRDESAQKDRGDRDHHDADHGDRDRRHEGDRNGHRDGDRDRHDDDRDHHNRCGDDGHCRCWDCHNRCWDCHRGCWDCYNYYYDDGYHSCYDYSYSCGSYYDGHNSNYRNYPVFNVSIHLG